MSDVYDLAVIGGGINGAGIAADASARGLRILLAEAGDLGGGTSSTSSKLIHGGLRYLEHYEFRLVREALREREVLLANAPHLIRPLRFLLPIVPGMRAPILMRAGLFLYDHLAQRKRLGPSRSIDLQREPAGQALRTEFARGFSYWDCWVDDARLVVANAVAARDAGADIRVRAPVTAIAADDGLWRLTVGGKTEMARALVNASGPYVADVARMIGGGDSASPLNVRLVRGSHIVVPRIPHAEDAFTLQNGDGRVVFALPFEDAFTLLGTTEVSQAEPKAGPVSAEEEDYLLDAAARFFRQAPKRKTIAWRFSGVRPLVDDGQSNTSAVTRDYRFVLDLDHGPAVLHVVGGKITTYRKLAAAALAKLAPHLPTMGLSRTATTPLPGGDIGHATFEEWFETFAEQRPQFPRPDLMRLARRYGTRATRIVPEGARLADLGVEVAAGLSEAELDYLKREEWTTTAEAALWRRTKAGLALQPEQRISAALAIQNFLDRT